MTHPMQGGSFVRQPDGTLTPADKVAPATPPVDTPPDKPARARRQQAAATSGTDR